MSRKIHAPHGVWCDDLAWSVWYDALHGQGDHAALMSGVRPGMTLEVEVLDNGGPMRGSMIVTEIGQTLNQETGLNVLYITRLAAETQTARLSAVMVTN